MNFILQGMRPYDERNWNELPTGASTPRAHPKYTKTAWGNGYGGAPTLKDHRWGIVSLSGEPHETCQVTDAN